MYKMYSLCWITAFQHWIRKHLECANIR